MIMHSRQYTLRLCENQPQHYYAAEYILTVKRPPGNPNQKRGIAQQNHPYHRCTSENSDDVNAPRRDDDAYLVELSLFGLGQARSKDGHVHSSSSVSLLDLYYIILMIFRK